MNASTFTAADLARCEATSRALLSPLLAPSVDAWRRAVNRAVRDLFDGDASVFMLPGVGALYYSDDGPSVIDGLNRYASLSPDGLHVVQDPVVALWHAMRRTEGMEAFSWEVNADMVQRSGHKMENSSFVQEVLLNNGLHNFVGAYSRMAEGEVLLWVLQEQSGAGRFGSHDADVMRVLVPSLKAGLEALDRLKAHRTALDLIDTPLAAFDLDGREIFRNTALSCLLDGDPERVLIEGALQMVAQQVRTLFVPGCSATGATLFVPTTHETNTRRGRYVLRATVAASGAFCTDESVLVSVEAQRGPTIPGAGVLRERFGLTRREAEVAALMAEGRSNAEVAERLFISMHTAKRHAERVLEKLGINSRSAVHARLLNPVP